MRVRVLVMVMAALAVPAPVLAAPATPVAGPEAQLAAFAAKPPAASDIAARFGYASALADVGRTGEAITAFEALVADFPGRPEPYNNLAALYAHEGDFEKARLVLERGMHTSTSYAAIYENLSTVYVEMARNSYVKALRMKEAPPAPKLQMVTALERMPAPVEVSPAAAAATPPVVAAAAAPAPVIAPIELPAVDAAVAAAAVLDRWARAWSAQDADAYLAIYDEGFDPGDGLTRAVWAEQRRDRIARPAWIKVDLSELDVTADASSMVVVAKQRYNSNTYGDRTLKRFELVERDGRWLIRAEQTLRAIP